MTSDRFGSLMDDLFAWQQRPVRASDWRVRSDADGVEVEVDLPGFAKDDVAVAVEGDVLTVTAESEGRPGRSRSFRLSDAVDPGAVGATLRNGVLTVRVGKSEKAKSRRIEIGS